MWIVDDFFKDPYNIRNISLKLKDHYRSDKDYRWPGYRVDAPQSLAVQYTSKVLDVTQDEKLEISNCYFQYSDASYGTGSVHHDPGKYTCITYLNPNPSSNSGTEVYTLDNPGGDDYNNKSYNIKNRFYSSDRNPIQKFFFEKKVKEFNSIFKDPCIVANKFNRTLIFDSGRCHRAQNFFGTALKDSRLTLILFLTAAL